MKIIEVDQRSPAWDQLRVGRPTASEFKNLITADGHIRKGEMAETYLCRKIAERWLGMPLPSTYYSGGGLVQGELRENEGIRIYAFNHRPQGKPALPIKTSVFLTTDDGRIGCSPDGLFDDGGGIEAKCPDIHTHIKYLLQGEVPDDYIPQVQGAMLVSGAPHWVFLSYCRNLPALELTVKRDEAFIEALRRALEVFLMRLDEGYKRLVELNGGVDPNAPDEDDGIIM